jgi:hypothetical protein
MVWLVNNSCNTLAEAWVDMVHLSPERFAQPASLRMLVVIQNDLLVELIQLHHRRNILFT